MDSLDPIAVTLMLIAGAQSFVFLCLMFNRWPHFTVVVILSTVSLQAFSLVPFGLSMGVTVYLPDVVFAAMLAVVFLNFMVFVEQDRLNSLLLTILALTAFNVLRGIGEFGLQTAVNEARYYVYFLAGAMYFSLLRKRLGDGIRFAKIWVIGGSVSGLIAVLFWILPSIAPSFQSVWSQQAEDWGNTPIRVLSVQHTMFILSGYLLSMWMAIRQLGSRIVQRMHWWLLPIVIVMSHRTTWVALVIGVLLLILVHAPLRKRLGLFVIAGSLALLAFGWIVFPESGTNGSSDWEATNTETLIWRLESVRLLVEDFWLWDAVNLIFGQPFGAGYEREISSQIVGVQPHNFYVQTLLSQGIGGLLALLSIYFLVLRRAFRCIGHENSVVFAGPVAVVILVSHLVFYVTYGNSMELGVLLGMTLGATGLDTRICSGPHIDSAPSSRAEWDATFDPHTRKVHR